MNAKNIYIILFMSLFNLISCKVNSQESITIYRTKEFTALEKNFAYSVPEAADLTAEFIHQEQPETSSFWLKLDVVYGDYFIFKDEPSHYNLKIAKYDLSGIWFHVKTGEIKRVKDAKSVKLILEPLKSLPFTKEYVY